MPETDASGVKPNLSSLLEIEVPEGGKGEKIACNKNQIDDLTHYTIV